MTATNHTGMPRNPALKQVTILDVQWSDCPEEVRDDVRELWIDRELNNDNCIVKYARNFDVEEYSEAYPTLYRYLEENNIKECWIHWWW